jgi:hypothetical protein
MYASNGEDSPPRRFLSKKRETQSEGFVGLTRRQMVAIPTLDLYRALIASR